jgi:hypothetical protein
MPLVVVVEHIISYMAQAQAPAAMVYLMAAVPEAIPRRTEQKELDSPVRPIPVVAVVVVDILVRSVMLAVPADLAS